MRRSSTKSVITKLQNRAQRLKTETYGLYLAARDPRTPWFVRLLVAAIVAYALSPVDLIPDFIPILGYLDDIILLPMGIALAIKFVPKAVLEDCRSQAQETLTSGLPVSRNAGVVIVVLWLLFAAIMTWWAYKLFI